MMYYLDSSARNCTSSPKTLELLLDGPLSTCVIIAGLIGNIYCIRVLYRTSINLTMLVSLTALAAWDIILLVVALFHHSLWATLHIWGLHPQRWDFYQVALNGLIECAYITSTWMLIEVSAERFFAVARPFHANSFRKDRRKRRFYSVFAGLIRVPLFMTAIACVITVPCSFEYHLEPCIYHAHTDYEKHETRLLKNPYYHVIYRTVILSILKTFGPFIIITLLTVSMVRSMRKSMDCRATILIEQGKNHLFQADCDRTNSLQIISILLLGKFLLLRCWPTFVEVLRVLFFASTGESTLPSLPLEKNHYNIIDSLYSLDTSQFLFLLNSATNSFIFVVLKKAFESRRLRRIRMRQRRMVAQHAEAVLSIGKLLAGGDRRFLLEEKNDSTEDNQYVQL